MSMAPEHWHEQLRRGTLELAVLLAIAPGRRYGLEILKHLEFADLVLAEGTIYPLLARLEREGSLNAEWVEGEGPRPRKYYQLTPQGRSRMKRMCAEFRAVAGGIEQMIERVLGRQP
jgi:PadR family transcriptional regulator, regulatory protein PadR